MMLYWSLLTCMCVGGAEFLIRFVSTFGEGTNKFTAMGSGKPVPLVWSDLAVTLRKCCVGRKKPIKSLVETYGPRYFRV